jgi:hypothetical protein
MIPIFKLTYCYRQIPFKGAFAPCLHASTPYSSFAITDFLRLLVPAVPLSDDANITEFMLVTMVTMVTMGVTFSQVVWLIVC